MTDPLALVTMPAPAMAAVPVVVPAADRRGAAGAVLPRSRSLAGRPRRDGHRARSPDGALMVQSGYGTLSLKTTQPLPPGTRVELRLQSGNPQTVSIVTLPPEPDAAEPTPTTQLDLGSTFTATVIAPPPGSAAAAGPGPNPGPTSNPVPIPAPASSADTPAVGARLLLRIAAPAQPVGPTTLLGQVAAGPAGETVIETPIGIIALDQRIGLPPGPAITFERLEQNAPADLSERAAADRGQRLGVARPDARHARQDCPHPRPATPHRVDARPAVGVGGDPAVPGGCALSRALARRSGGACARGRRRRTYGSRRGSATISSAAAG